MAINPSEYPLVLVLKKRLKEAREALQIPQRTAAKILAVSQKQVSDYENPDNAAVPSEDLVQRLEQRLAEQKVTLNSLAGSLPRPSARQSDAPRLVSDDAFYAHLRDFVSRWDTWRRESNANGDACEFFIFGAEHYPAFAEQRGQDLWSANLQKRVNYYLFGRVGLLTGGQIQDAYLTLKKIESRAATDSSSVGSVSNIYAHGLITGFDEDQATIADCQALARGTEVSGDGRVLVEVIDVRDKPRWLRAILLGAEMPVMVARLPLSPESISMNVSSMPPVTFAARREKNVSLVPDGSKETGWLFLDRRTTDDIIKYVDEIKPRPKASKK